MSDWKRRSIVVLTILLLFSVPCRTQQTHSQREKSAPLAAEEDMSLIPGATVQIGIDPIDVPRLQKVFGVEGMELFEAEIPKHIVTVSSFYIDRRLVTNSQFKKFVDQNAVWAPERISSDLRNGNYLRHWKSTGIPAGRENHPVVNVSWYAAVAYCQWRGKRLPTEAEWEHAARGGLNGLFPWGSEAVDKGRANYGGSGIGGTIAVGTYPANGYGLFDIAGNVWEYLADEWQPYTSDAQRNPVAGGDLFVHGDAFLKIKTRRVIRGGSYGGDPINLWVEYRDSHPPENAKEFVGFRCAKSTTKE
jgi:formylglycine-generating enzyme required for sulfatase activity